MPPFLFERAAKLVKEILPNMILKAPIIKTKAPRTTFPPVNLKISSTLKKIPEPTHIPTIIAVAVHNPYVLF